MSFKFAFGNATPNVSLDKSVACNKCGQYYLQQYKSAPNTCYQFKKDPNENECIIQPGSSTTACPTKPNSKSNFGKKHSGMSPWIIILITLALFALIVMLMKKKKMFFGKRR